MEIEALKQTVLAHVLAPNYRPVKPRVIAKQLKLTEDDHPALKTVLRKLIKEGQLTYGTHHLVGPGNPPKPQSAERPAPQPPAFGGRMGPPGPAKMRPKVKQDPPERVAIRPPRTAAADNTPSGPHGKQVTGLFRRAQAGFGFVRPAGSTSSHDREQDIFIAANRAGDAASGDTVLVRIRTKTGSRPNPEGEIVEVLERETHQFVGTYFETDGAAFVQVDGSVFSQPIAVGDPGAKNAQPDDKVVFEMVRFPSHYQSGEGVISEVLGARGLPGVDTLSIIREFGFPEAFAQDALDEARKEAEKFDETVPSDRDDLTGMTIITIDPIDARDFDDAISLELLENGHWRLGVHIADVSHFVRPGTGLDREAYKRATSVYLPDRVLPMLPEVISNALASLQPDRVRFTKTCFIEFTADGAFVAADLARAAIKSCRRFAYEEVDEFLADPEAWREKLTPAVHSLLERMRDLSRILRARRRKRGALELSMPEVKVDLNKNGEVTGAHVVTNTESHKIIEEFMLSANEAVAEHLKAHKLHFLRRVHPAPDPRKSKALSEFVKELGLETDSLEDRFELQKLLERVVELPECRAVNYAVLRSLQRAVYSPDDEGHFALASDCYCHFTSPIRRYPDLTIHRLVDAIISKDKPENRFDELVVVGQHCSDREQRAEEAERELTKIKLLTYLSTRIGDEMEAVVTGVEEYGLFVQGIKLPAEGLLHVNSLSDDYYTYDRKSHTLTGRREGNTYRLGDVLEVKVARVDVDRRELDFRLVAFVKSAERVEKPSKAKDKHKKGKKDKGKGKSKGHGGKNRK